MKNIAIIGGGLAGLITGIELAKKGVPCQLFERKKYPFHRVCGEYVSNEAMPYLKKNDLYPADFIPSILTKFQLSSVRGKWATMPLDLGGFGISRYQLDHFLFQKAKHLGVEVFEDTDVQDVIFHDEKFFLRTPHREFVSDVVVGAFGKRSKLDLQFRRSFTEKRSPYVGIKYHARTDHAHDLISLHNFHGGYCGISNVEGGITNICYLVKRDVVQHYGSISAMEQGTLFQNPLLKSIFTNADFLMKKPLVINEINFETKAPVEHHILMTGDAAGMIAPLCGNGMAIAIHTGLLVADSVGKFCQGQITRTQMESCYAKAWTNNFSGRLRFGRIVQKLFGNETLSGATVNLALYSKPIAKIIMKNTHGPVF